jgi:uncharacterized protein
MIERVVHLAEWLRAAGFDVSTGEVIDAVEALQAIDLADRRHVRAALRAALVKQDDPLGRFDHAFEALFDVTAPRTAVADRPSPGPRSAAPGVGGALDAAVLAALVNGDDVALGWLAEQAVDRYGDLDGDGDASAARVLRRVLRGVDLSRMLSAAMHQLRRTGDLDELALLMHRHDIADRLDAFRRQLARVIDARIARRTGTPALPATPVDELALLHLSITERDELRRVLQPFLRRLAARAGRRRRRSTGRVDLRRTIRRSLQSGGVPLDVATRRRHPHRPDLVVLCDVSGSVAEFAQFTFTLVDALHTEVRDVRSFAFVGGIAEVTDLFRAAQFDIPVNRLVERRGLLGLDGHSDYGAVFRQFRERHLDAVVGDRTTLVIAGDARGNHHPPGTDDFAVIAGRARRVLWLNPEPAAAWGRTDSLIDEYRANCTAVKEVRTLRQLADAIDELA